MKLSRSQQKVMEMLARGKSHKEIAAELGVHLDTARVQLHRARIKLGARTTYQAMAVFGALSNTHIPPEAKDDLNGLD